MQQFALDNNKQYINSNEALTGINYYCPECESIMRVRGGDHYRYHFYHLKKNEYCRQSSKSIIHLNIQNYIEKELKNNGYDVKQENPFSIIHRIADVCCHNLKLIFEVQCSHIKPEEIRARNRDYNSIGYDVVWILSDKKLYNKYTLTPAEKYLGNLMHYYSNIDNNGKGSIYDQFQTVINNKRYYRHYRHNIDLSKPNKFKEKINNKSIGTRYFKWDYYFNNDLYQYLLEHPDTALFKIMQREERKIIHNKVFTHLTLIQKSLKKYAQNILNFLIDQSISK